MLVIIFRLLEKTVNINFKTLSIIFFIFSVSNLNAQIEKKAQTGFRFLENPVSAEVIGRGGVGVVSTLSSNAIFGNPSLLAFIERDYDISLNHTSGIADINYNAIAASINLFDFGKLGFSLLAMDYGLFYSTVRLGEDGYLDMGTFSPTAISVGIAFAQKISNRFSYGVHVKYARQNLGEAYVIPRNDSLLKKKEYKLDVAAFDVGALYDFNYNGIKFGATLQNISRELSYEREDFPLPFAVSFGFSIEPLKFFPNMDPIHSVIINFESRHPRDFGEKIKIGSEYHYMDFLTIRAGYQINYDERNWSAGIGVKQELSGFPIRVDYAFQPFGILGDVHHISLGVSY